MSYFRSTIFRHRRGNNNGSPDDEGRDNPHENQRRLATEGGSKELGSPALEEHPGNIKQSINAKTFLSGTGFVVGLKGLEAIPQKDVMFVQRPAPAAEL
ncbi:hypothetical protein H113_01257 [Trichophyton rubrum MR1459]|nr:hypothetical protein H104_01240 [Trichophyton rubrum CBS 289.86]EZF99018.1 hypothetical protein H113_01257 [Trichophyton rubrum MR1459]EZG10075.1 hypothetical protein H106_01052 [Trichophyton rubrum CBS 735.88]